MDSGGSNAPALMHFIVCLHMSHVLQSAITLASNSQWDFFFFIHNVHSCRIWLHSVASSHERIKPDQYCETELLILGFFGWLPVTLAQKTETTSCPLHKTFGIYSTEKKTWLYIVSLKIKSGLKTTKEMCLSSSSLCYVNGVETDQFPPILFSISFFALSKVHRQFKMFFLFIFGQLWIISFRQWNMNWN